MSKLDEIIEQNTEQIRRDIERRLTMPKKKDVFVWVARDNDNDGMVALFKTKPVYRHYNGHDVFFPKRTGHTLGLYRQGKIRGIHLKKGQCKKYKLVEVKGGLGG